MVPTLSGRIQTRTFLIFLVGIPWTLLISVILPDGAPLGTTYKYTFTGLALIWIIGCVFWEPLYHALMQFRWEKDWPIIFILFEVIPEAILVFFLLGVVYGDRPDVLSFAIHVGTTWFLVWCMANGPMRVIFHRWRFRGGEIIGWT